MADRFPSLEDFDSGGKVAAAPMTNWLLTPSYEAQTDIQNPSVEPSTDDFLAREKAVLGDDAEQFATANDASALDEGDLLGGDGGNGASTFESQFPDLASPSAVSILGIAAFFLI